MSSVFMGDWEQVSLGPWYFWKAHKTVMTVLYLCKPVDLSLTTNNLWNVELGSKAQNYVTI